MTENERSTLEKSERRSWSRGKILTAAKYGFSALITLSTLITVWNFRFVLAALAELACIFLLSNCLADRRAGRVLNSFLCFLYNAQILVLFFGGSYIRLVMLDNLHSIRALEGKALPYGLGAALVLIFSCLPVEKLRLPLLKKRNVLGAALALAAEIALLMVSHGSSPFGGYVQLANEMMESHRQRIQLNNRLNDLDVNAAEFFSESITDGRSKDAALPASPNVILIFTEGLSRNIAQDDRDIMPNLSALEARSLHFTGYYNHTFATYRGLSGQLYSGYQMDNLDVNNLISLQDIFKMNHYRTAFINTEPKNPEFTGFLGDFGFDELLGGPEDELLGMSDSYSDAQTYEMLFNAALRLNEEAPFFLATYTFGTHASFDSVGEGFGNRDNRVLNRFNEVDRQLGEFLEKFEASGLAENTLLVFTADHAAYQDSDFTAAFPDYRRTSSMVDEIPLCFYFKGMAPEVVEAGGRNSLDLAPTLLDYLDMDYVNYFLGNSLFAPGEEGLAYDTVFNEGVNLLCTAGGAVRQLTEEEIDGIRPGIQNYFAVKRRELPGATPVPDQFESRIEATLSPEGDRLELIYIPQEAEDYPNLWFFVWSAADGQDDKAPYRARLRADGSWYAAVDLASHTALGEKELYIHAYGGTEGAEDCLDKKTVILE